MCPASESLPNPDQQTEQWLAIYATPLAKHLNDWIWTMNKNANLPANVTETDVYALLSMCAFHTAFLSPSVSSTALGKETIVLSPFCHIFDELGKPSLEKMWKDYEYQGDLDKYYGNG